MAQDKVEERIKARGWLVALRKEVKSEKNLRGIRGIMQGIGYWNDNVFAQTNGNRENA